MQKTVDFYFPASNLLTILIQYCKNFLDRIIWSLLNSNCFLASTHSIKYYWLAIIFFLVENDNSKQEKIGSVE